MLSTSDDNLPLFGSDGADLLSYSLNLIIKCLLLVEIADLVFVSFILEILSLIRCESLPLFTDFLHHL
jgi:hypothetical protein